MSGPFGSSQWMYATGAEEGQSLRFEDGDVAHLSKTFASAGDRTKYTISLWTKLGNRGVWKYLFAGGTSSNGGQRGYLNIDGSDRIYFQIGDSSVNTSRYYITDAVYRDPSAWYHIVLAVDTTRANSYNSTAGTNRVELYVNGDFVSFGSATNAVGLNYANSVINNNTNHYIGQDHLGTSSSTNNWDGYMANFCFIDGTALDPTSFGEYDGTLWKPKDVSGLTFGTNGFFLDFSDSSAIGDDTSGNGNDWTANNLAATDVVLDSPVTGGNFCTWNPLQPTGAGAGVMTLSEGNLKATGGSSIYRQVMGNMSVKSGKWYTETYISDAGFPSWMIGWTYGKRYEAFTTDATYLASIGYFTGSNVYFSSFGTGYAALQVAYSGLWSGARAPTTGDVIGCAIDFDNGNVWWSINGEWVDVGSGAGDPANGTNPSQTFTASTYADDDKSPHYVNYNGSAILNAGQDSSFAGNITAGGNTDDNGQGDFKYSVPSGFLCLKTSNLDTPTITAPDEYHGTLLFTGNGSTQSITGLGWQPDFTWIKMRSDGTRGHALFDAVRGGTERLDSSSTQEGRTNEGNISFDADGFSVTSSHPTVNDSGDSAVAWNWLASNSTSSNTDGDQTTTISANPTAGFSVGTFTAPSTYINFTTGHGLSAAPEMVILKRRDSTSDWWVWHKDLPNAATGRALKLNSTSGEINGAYFDQSNMTTTTVGYTSSIFITSADYVQYVFHEVEGYSKVGSYLGNSSSDGTFVHCGFRPTWILVKSTSSATQWMIYDNKREGYNVDNDALTADDSAAEKTDNDVDFLSNGFKLRRSSPNFNYSGYTYIFYAVAEAPFKSANAR